MSQLPLTPFGTFHWTLVMSITVAGTALGHQQHQLQTPISLVRNRTTLIRAHHLFYTHEQPNQLCNNLGFSVYAFTCMFCNIWIGLTLSKSDKFQISPACSLTRNITSHSMKNVALHSLLRRNMIALPSLTTSLLNLGVKVLRQRLETLLSATLVIRPHTMVLYPCMLMQNSCI